MQSRAMTYFSPAATVLTSTFLYKGGVLIPISIGGSIILTTIIEYVFHTEFMGVTIGFLLIISVLILVDFWTGILASRHEERVLIKKEEKEQARDKQFNSSKMTFTFFKFMMLFVWIWLAFSIQHRVEGIGWLETTYSTIVTIPLILVALREYVSIGENIERVYGKKPYMFNLVEKIFEIVEGKFFKKLKEDNDENLNDYED